MKRAGWFLFFMTIIIHPAEKGLGKKLIPFYKVLPDNAIECQFPLSDGSHRICGKQFTLKAVFKNHYGEAHEGKTRKRSGLQSLESRQRQLEKLAEKVICPVPGCGKEMRKGSVYEHTGSQHPEYQPYECGYCSMSFSKQRDAKAHEKEHFSDSEQRTALKAYDTLDRVFLTEEEADFLNRRVHALNAEHKATFQEYIQRIRTLFARELVQKGAQSDTVNKKVEKLVLSYNRCPKEEGSLFTRKKEGIFTIPEKNRYVVSREEKKVLDRFLAETDGLQEAASKDNARQRLQSNIQLFLEKLKQEELDLFHIGQKRNASEAHALEMIDGKYTQLKKRLHEICSIVPMYGPEYNYEFKEACLKVGEDAGHAAAVELELPYNVRWQNSQVEVINTKRLDLLRELLDEIVEANADDDEVDYQDELKQRLEKHFPEKKNRIDEYIVWFNRVFTDYDKSGIPIVGKDILVVEEEQRLEITREQQELINKSIKEMRVEHEEGLNFYEDLDAFKKALIQKAKKHYDELLGEAEVELTMSAERLDNLQKVLSKKYRDFKKVVTDLPCYGRDQEYRFKPAAVKVISGNGSSEAGPAE